MIQIVGIGPGEQDLILPNAKEKIEDADVVIGSPRQLGLFQVKHEMKLPKLAELKLFLEQNTSKNIVLLASGDPNLYGIANWARREFGKNIVNVVPGISSIQYMFNRVGIAMNDSFLTSSHGRHPDFDFLLQHVTVGMVTDENLGPFEIAQEILKRKQRRLIYIGEQLSSADEQISCYPAEQVPKKKFKMNVVLITNE
ncbi:cobalt-precorrin-7 (C(5))-methyltransferase [Pediococcus claussenii]|uniref:Precorrin-6Y C5,15-methyltransferase (Decarboxylating), CbiE subunit n=1 Tax=Pediococcus claussenii (strain ATCC BAA-344 / DSM 14800 / JCM 18046 / KCTC 3811 / LMG 21948 / P06) TaxID=701521 RepID=G8PEL4_PEDCP|nr:cobalt-precorrin-7 (C(5))-methyltransferase [Pediococcus claussenii]AEV95623.1 precorrin-6Y C5,15-methyltransferase (decarboxylating), CbiE subunit [Pediococcus claussenii ATCC BAA-344]ANZ69143.1 cobalt-precorrin-6Y C(5)-methyltransferase [Pediococcus claussenii]ANZ70960.1 cobalt-precorrin-6Y C(5)-methyltransferase [Pediococcus claussenii]KRN20144.1 cbiE protein [Pediococcus claussenii]